MRKIYKKVYGLSCVYLIMGMPLSSFSALLIYEGFNYTSGSALAGNSGGGSFGWSGAWSTISSGGGTSSSDVGVTSLVPANASNLQESGLDAVLSTASGLSAASITSTRNFGVSLPSSSWISFVANFDSPVQASSTVNLGTPSLSYGGTELNFGAIGVVGTAPDAAANTFYVININGTSADFYIPTSLTTLGSIRASVTGVTTPTSLSLNSMSQFLTLPGSSTFGFDEFRVGDSFADVSPAVPEPSTFIVMSTGLLMLMYQGYRRKRTSCKEAPSYY